MEPKEYYETYWSDQGFYPHGRITPALAERFLTYIRPGWKCLDVGCGDGRTAGVWLRDHGCEYIGVDVSTNAVGDAQSLGLDARVIEDAAALPFSAGTFDVVVCIEVLEHLFQSQLVASEILRVLKPGGVLIATVPNVAYWRRRVELGLLGKWNPMGDDLAVEQPWRDPHIRFFNRGALRRLLAACGYTSIRIGGHAGGIFPWESKWRWEGPLAQMYQYTERAAPSLFGLRLDAVAYKPEPVSSR